MLAAENLRERERERLESVRVRKRVREIGECENAKERVRGMEVVCDFMSE
jgi:hypothetical protein